MAIKTQTLTETARALLISIPSHHPVLETRGVPTVRTKDNAIEAKVYPDSVSLRLDHLSPQEAQILLQALESARTFKAQARSL